MKILICYLLFIITSFAATAQQIQESEIMRLTKNTAWCWFQDDRVIIDGDQLIMAGVTSKGANTVAGYNMVSGEEQSVVMNKGIFKPDDHNEGVLMVRPDGRYLTVYGGHGVEPNMRYRISTHPGDVGEWEPEQVTFTEHHYTYSNVYRLSSTGKTYNFHRGVGWFPNYMVSDDDGDTWHYGGILFTFLRAPAPYVRYASNEKDRVHFITTEGHPRYFNNSIYHGYIKDGVMYGSDGTKVGDLSQDKNTEIQPDDFTTIFDGDSTTRANVAWTSDIQLDEQGNPYVGFSVTKDPIKLWETNDTKVGGFDHRYHYARWDGQQWTEHEIAYGGSRLYAGENEYTGLITLHPSDPNVVYISTDVNPETGELMTKKRKQRHEIFKGTTTDEGASWEWTAITQNSKRDNIRPIVVASDDWEAVVWLRGKFKTYMKYKLDAYGIVKHKK